MWERVWRRASSPRPGRIWLPWRRTTRRSAWTLSRARERRRVKSTKLQSSVKVITGLLMLLYFYSYTHFSTSSSWCVFHSHGLRPVAQSRSFRMPTILHIGFLNSRFLNNLNYESELRHRSEEFYFPLSETVK